MLHLAPKRTFILLSHVLLTASTLLLGPSPTLGLSAHFMPVFYVGLALNGFAQGILLPPALPEVLEALGGAEVDVLLIDGDHTYEGAKQDFDDYAPLVREGGLVILHDTIPNPSYDWIKVPELWEELTAVYGGEAIEDDGQWGGFGVITWKEAA